MANSLSKLTTIVDIRKEWSRQAEWIVAFLERLSVNQSSHGTKWTLNMMKHYNQRFARHARKVPNGCACMRAQYRLRLQKANAAVNQMLDNK